MSGLGGNLPAGLRRFVAEVGVSTSLDDDGFLEPPVELLRAEAGTGSPRLAAALAGLPGSFVLLGAGGAGKSWTLEQLARAEGVEMLDLAACLPGDLREWLAAASRDESVFLDTVDLFEGSAGAGLRLLARELGGAARRGVRVRLGCRAALWRESLAAKLAEFEELVLLPLDRVTAVGVLTDEGIDGEAFVMELVAARRGRMSASPQRLMAAARYWDANRRLAESSRAAIAFEVDEFLAEYDEDRPVHLAADRARRIAQRLAAVHIFCDAKSFTSAAGRSSASVSGLPSEAEPDAPGVEFAPADYAHVLDTALFDAARSGEVAFRHQQYAEYLAASYLADRRVSGTRVLQLLDVHSNGLVPAARIGVAGWLMALQPELIPHLVADNVEGLIQAGVEIPADEIRESLVDALLVHAVERGLTSGGGLDLSLVAHPGLEDQLTRYLDDQPGDITLWWVSRLAVAGGCRRLSRRLASCAQDRDRGTWVRKSLVRAVARFGDESAIDTLRDLLPIDAGEDPHCELAGALLDALYPSVIDARQVLPLLDLHRIAGEASGSMWVAVRRLAERIPTLDLPVFLEWLAVQPEDYRPGSDMDELYTGAVRAAWIHSDSDVLRTSLAAALATSPQFDRWVLHQNRSEAAPWCEGCVDQRRTLLLEVAQRTDADAWYKLLELQLIGSPDIVWLLEELPSMAQGTAAALTSCLGAMLGYPSAEVADRILSLEPTHPAYAVTQWCRQSVSVQPSSDDAWYRLASRKRAAAQNRAQKIDGLAEATRATLLRARSDIEAWWEVVHILSFDDDARASAGRFVHDLTRRPGFARLSSEDQAWLIDRGVEYLRTHQPQIELWRHKKKFSLAEVLPDWSGVYLMATLLLHAPGWSDELCDQDWMRWIPVIATAWGSADSGDDAVRAELLKAAPDEARAVAVRTALDQFDQLDTNGRLLSPYGVYRELMSDLAPELSARLADGRCTGDLAVEALEIMVEATPTRGAELCRVLAQQNDSPLQRNAQEHLAQFEPNTIVDELVADNEPLVNQASLLDRLKLINLDDEHLTVLARRLLKDHPYSADPPIRYGVHSAQPIDDVQLIRNRALMQLAERGLTEAIAHLGTNLKETDAQVLRQFERTARAREAEQAITTLTPDSLFKLLRHGDHRLVRNSADLLAVVLEILDNLQQSITAKAAFNYLWDEKAPKPEDVISDWVKREVDQRFGQGLIIDREIQVTRQKKRGGIGTRIDLTATAPTATTPAALARVIIEAKRIDNRELTTSLITQLDQKYMAPEGVSHGIYLVYWVADDQRPTNWHHEHQDVGQLKDLLQDQAATATPGLHIVPRILDISRPGNFGA